ncbi:MAG: metallophosphoesterase family protein [Thermoplasmatota archaeon]
MPGSSSVRLFHLSDTHLGHQQYSRVDGEGLNQREQDHAAAFMEVVAHAERERPDLVIHAGDLFDGVRPTNRALAVAQEGFLRLSRAGIPVVLIAGNHEHPKLRETGSALRLFSHLPHVHPVFSGHGETVALAIRGMEVRVHAVPQCADNEALASEIAGLRPSASGLDVLVVHGAVSGLKAFSHAEFNEQSLDVAWFDGRFHYVALGHFHGVREVAPRAWYSGATERVSIAEAGQEKGFLDVTVARENVEAHFRPLPVRPYVDIPPVECHGLAGPAVVASARAALGGVPAGAVARLRLADVEGALRGSLDVAAIRDAAAQALHLDLVVQWADRFESPEGASSFGSLVEEFEAFASRIPLADRSVVPLGRQVLLGGPLP